MAGACPIAPAVLVNSTCYCGPIEICRKGHRCHLTITAIGRRDSTTWNFKTGIRSLMPSPQNTIVQSFRLTSDESASCQAGSHMEQSPDLVEVRPKVDPSAHVASPAWIRLSAIQLATNPRRLQTDGRFSESKQDNKRPPQRASDTGIPRTGAAQAEVLSQTSPESPVESILSRRSQPAGMLHKNLFMLALAP